MVQVPVSAGELIDKVTILRLKHALLKDAEKLRHVTRELTLLEAIEQAELAPLANYGRLAAELFAVNAALWDIEDRLRDCERRGDFGREFIGLARSVYLKNDLRSELKRRMNVLLGSDIVEEKSYAPYSVRDFSGDGVLSATSLGGAP